jgi:hypothetical protein
MRSVTVCRGTSQRGGVPSKAMATGHGILEAYALGAVERQEQVVCEDKVKRNTRRRHESLGSRHEETLHFSTRPTPPIRSEQKSARRTLRQLLWAEGNEGNACPVVSLLV